MIKFNSSDTIVGEIKQLLHSFNLPKAKVLKDQQSYIPNTIYIKNQLVYRSSKDGSSIEEIKDIRYYWGDKLLNITHTMDITNSIYDSYTHKYLGEYLRFLRDYRKINLMSMYNCFSNEVPTNLYKEVMIGNNRYIFDTKDSGHVLYMIPIKLGEVYTISLNTPRPVSMIAGFYANGEVIGELLTSSFRAENSCYSNQVFLYDGVKNINMVDLNPDVWNKEDCLYLFLNLPASYNASIVILEGDYRESANVYLNENGYTEIIYKPVINTGKTLVVKPASRLQLLAQRCEYSYPFADKLIQYLTANVISPTDEISNNIKLAQLKLNKEKYLKTISHYGVWSDEETAACLMCSHNNLIHREVYKDFDVLGYLDNDIESELGGLHNGTN